MADTIKLRQLDTFKSLNNNELEILRFNFWMIEQALNSVGAATPLVPGSGSPSISDHHLLTNLTTFDDHPQYLFLNGRNPAQILITSIINQPNLKIRAIGGQTAKLIEFQNANPTTLAAFDTSGSLIINNAANLAAVTYAFNNILHTDSSGASPFTITGDAYVVLTTGGSNAGNLSIAFGGNGIIAELTGGLLTDVKYRIRATGGQTANLFELTDATNSTKLIVLNKNGNFVDDTFRICDNGDPTKLLAFELSGITTVNTRTVTIPDFSGTALLINTSTIVRGDIIVANSTPVWTRLAKGAANQALVMDGAGNDPQWATLTASNNADRNRTIFLPAAIWFDVGNGVSLGQNLILTGTHPTAYFYGQMSGAADTKYSCEFIVPEDLVSGSAVTFEILYANNGVSNAQITFDFYIKSLTNGDLMTAANDISQTNINLIPSSTKDNLNIQTLSTSSTGLIAGKLMRISLMRQGADTNTGAMNFMGIKMTYTANM